MWEGVLVVGGMVRSVFVLVVFQCLSGKQVKRYLGVYFITIIQGVVPGSIYVEG